jgi:hypothetical protein
MIRIRAQRAACPAQPGHPSDSSATPVDDVAAGRGRRLSRLVIAGSVAIALFAVAGCDGGLPIALPSAIQPASGDGGSGGSGVSSSFFSGDTSSVPVQLADKLGCSGASGNDQLERYVSSELDCLLDGDNEVSIFSFANTGVEQAWFDLGPQAADDSGTVVYGAAWAVEPFNVSQVSEIQHELGGQILRQGGAGG